MIQIHGASGLKDKMKLIYNPLSELSLALDLLCHPEHHSLHAAWAENVLNGLSNKERRQLMQYEQELDGYFNLDRQIDFLSYPFASDDSAKACSAYIKSKENWISSFRNSDMEKITSFLGFLWKNYILPVVEEHLPAIRMQIDTGARLLEESGLSSFVPTINDRMMVGGKDVLKIEKWVDSVFHSDDLENFYIELSVFAFPHLVISDRHEAGSFFVSMDVPFRNDQVVVPGIERISAKAFALSDKSRLRILFMLSQNPMTQKELARLMGFAKSTISRHINILLESDLIESDEGGRNVLLKVKAGNLDNISKEIRNWMGKS